MSTPQVIYPLTSDPNTPSCLLTFDLDIVTHEVLIAFVIGGMNACWSRIGKLVLHELRQ